MAAIYEPKGAAREYSPLALNYQTGCDHGCVYCYVPKMMQRFNVLQIHAVSVGLREGNSVYVLLAVGFITNY